MKKLVLTLCIMLSTAGFLAACASQNDGMNTSATYSSDGERIDRGYARAQRK